MFIQTEAALLPVSPFNNFPFTDVCPTLWMSVLCTKLSSGLYQALFPPLAIHSYQRICLCGFNYGPAPGLLLKMSTCMCVYISAPPHTYTLMHTFTCTHHSSRDSPQHLRAELRSSPVRKTPTPLPPSPAIKVADSSALQIYI